MLICGARNNADGWSLSHWHLPAVVIYSALHTQHSSRMWTAAALVIKYLSAAHRGKENHSASVFQCKAHAKRASERGLWNEKYILDFHAAAAFCFVRALLCLSSDSFDVCTVSFSINLNFTLCVVLVTLTVYTARLFQRIHKRVYKKNVLMGVIVPYSCDVRHSYQWTIALWAHTYTSCSSVLCIESKKSCVCPSIWLHRV